MTRDTDPRGRRWRDHRTTVTKAVAVDAAVQASAVMEALTAERIRVAAEWKLAECSIKDGDPSADTGRAEPRRSRGNPEQGADAC